MKILIYFLMACAVALIVFNFTKLDFDYLMEGNSAVAFISIVAGMCALLALTILLISKKIAARVKK
ncbi:hypothetical protein F3C99_01370 [Vitellibacter sp. q18]|jgi:hypothetical protein|nr:hypothetical protein [Aequorivita lutea]